MKKNVTERKLKIWLSSYKVAFESTEKHKTARDILRSMQKETNNARIFLRELSLINKSKRGTYYEVLKNE